MVVFLLFQNTGIRDYLGGVSGGNSRPVSIKIKVESEFEEYFEVSKVTRGRQPNTGEVIEFTLKRREKFPVSDKEIDELYKDPDNSRNTIFILDSLLLRRRVQYEMYDEKETVLQSGTFSVRKLIEDESTVVRVKTKVKASIVYSLRLSPS